MSSTLLLLPHTLAPSLFSHPSRPPLPLHPSFPFAPLAPLLLLSFHLLLPFLFFPCLSSPLLFHYHCTQLLHLSSYPFISSRTFGYTSVYLTPFPISYSLFTSSSWTGSLNASAFPMTRQEMNCTPVHNPLFSFSKNKLFISLFVLLELHILDERPGNK